jgi:hypothetical protein
MLDDEVRQILRELVEELGARSAVITEAPEERSGVPARTLPLGGGGFLRVELGTRSHAGQTVDVALERCVRALRAAARRWETELPTMGVGGGAPGEGAAGPVTVDKVKERIGAYLSALATIGPVENAVLLVKGAVIASGRALQELEEARWPFIARRVAAAREAGSSHGELADPDFYAVEFWYGATLVLYLTPPYALDFVRFRCRQVTRELAQLLPLLEPDPAAPAAIRPTD